MFPFEFYLYTGDSLPVCYCQSVNSIHERKIMNMHIKVLEDDNWICDCVGPWGSLMLLVSKPHQEGCKDSKEFIWRLCDSYHPLNSVTRNFKLPIPRCTHSIKDFGDINGEIVQV